MLRKSSLIRWILGCEGRHVVGVRVQLLLKEYRQVALRQLAQLDGVGQKVLPAIFDFQKTRLQAFTPDCEAITPDCGAITPDCGAITRSLDYPGRLELQANGPAL